MLGAARGGRPHRTCPGSTGGDSVHAAAWYKKRKQEEMKTKMYERLLENEVVPSVRLRDPHSTRALQPNDA